MNGIIGSKVVHQDDIKNLKDVHELNVDNPNPVGGVGAIHLPPVQWNVVFHITRTIFYIFQLKGLLVGLPQEDSHEHIRTIIDVGGSFYSKNISQE